MPIIEVEHVTKEYQLGTLIGIGDRLANAFNRIRRKPLIQRERFKALDDVSFTVEQGEVVGIIGHNGAGKSTLFKILARVTTPTSGKISVRGSLAPLIEVGAGINPELTGRENIYLNASILGIPKKIIRRKVDEIIEFSELEQFIDTPVKHYSSGMRVKLGFSIATSLDAEILIIDEVLAVGDIAFQRKCLNRMEDMINSQHRTVLIVGHNIRQLERICSRMMLLKHGRIECDGEPGKVTKQFLDETTLNPDRIVNNNQGIRPHFNSGDVDVLSVEIITDEQNDGTPVCRLFSDLHIRIQLYAHHSFKNVEINFGLHNPEMVFIIKSSTSLLNHSVDLTAGINTLDILVERLPLCAGTYGIGFAIYDWSRRPLWGGSGLVWIAVEAPSDVSPRLPPSTLAYLPARWTISTGSEAIPDSSSWEALSKPCQTSA